MAEVRYKTVGTSVMTPTAMTRRKEILVPMVLTDYTLLYHYGDLDRTPVRNATFLATLSNGEKRTGVLDDTGRAQLCGVPKGPVSVTYQHDAPDSDDADIVAARDKIRQALDAIVAQTRLDMADEWKEWNEAGWLKRQYLETINTAQGGAVGAWHWLSGTVDTVWQLGVLLYKFDKEKREINKLFLTGQWAELDKKLASYRAKGVQVLGEASEVKELLNLIFHDQKTRELIASFAGRWWAAIPPDEQRELVASGGMQIIIDVVIGVLLAAFTAGAAGAAYGSAKWAASAGRLGARLTKLLDKLKESFELLAKALRVRKRKVIDVERRANGAKVIETTWKPVAAELARLFPLKLKALERPWIGEHLPGNTQWRTPPSQVRYLDATERARYKLTIRNGKVYDSKGKLFDTHGAKSIHSHGSNKTAIFVMDEEGSLYAGSHEYGKFHHSSFLAGQPVAAAGEIEISSGVIRSITDQSGHYWPPAEHLRQALQVIEAQGIKSSTIKVTIFGK